MFVSHHDDELLRTERGYGNGQKPDDYLDGFATFLREHMNDIPALIVVTQRPRELTRKQLKELAIALANEGYTETQLGTAWEHKTNASIAATIIGFVRQAALGDPLVAYGDRVERAVSRMIARGGWTKPQQDWLRRFGKQIKLDRIVDREAVDAAAFADAGGFVKLNKTFEGKLEQVLGDLHGAIWSDAG